MSTVINNIGAMPGVIYRIALENFVTYKQVELYPSKNLNVIIGPNGTGKSTFVCAIILGLCGKTNVIGRAKKLSEYVRTGCKKATIEIELYRAPGERNVVITRHFDLESHNDWSIDHKTAREKQVQELISSMNIQVDNLCQLLPQDRVQDFSNMEPPELLKSTLLAVGESGKVEVLNELIECRNKQKLTDTKLNNNATQLQEQENLNERLKVIIETMQQRKAIEQEIIVCEKKKLWLEYQELRQKVVELSNDKKDSMNVLASHKKKMAPLEKRVTDSKRELSDMEREKLAESREILNLKEKSKQTIDSSNNLNYRIKDIENEFREKCEQIKQRENDINVAEAKLRKFVNDLEILKEAAGDESKVKMELAELQQPINKTNQAIEKLKKDKMVMQYEIENRINPEMRSYQHQLRGLEDVAVKRLEQLRAYNEDCYQAVLWLRKNRDMFQHNVYEPMVMELNFTDPKFAIYLENTVQGRDLLAFTFESAQDMNTFLRAVRKTLKTVNAICSPPNNLRTQSPDINEISHLGFYTYLVDTIVGPTPIVKYLCKQYSVHRIPIGDDSTFKKSEKVPAHIRYFYTEKHRLTSKVSAYTGAKTCTTSEIRPARLLANNVDLDQLNNFRHALSELEEKAADCMAKTQTIDTKLGKLHQNLNELLTQRKELGESIENIKSVESRIRIQKRKVESLKNEPTLDLNSEKQKCAQKLDECTKKQIKLHEELKGCVQKLHKCVFNSKLWKSKLDESRKNLLELESQLRELKNDMINVQQTHDAIERQLNQTKTKAKEKLNTAKASCNNKLPQDPEFPYREQFESLPGDILRLQEHCFELQTRIECMDQADEQVLKEFAEREKLIKKLKAEVANSGQSKRELDNRIKHLKERWVPPVVELLRKIDLKFSDMFAKLGCTGEVKLETDAGEEEFDKYGIGIMVGFRTSESISRLSRYAQSGGERALSVALFLVALQTLTTLPFRCVDEINQGMDPVNERKMFQLLVAATTQCQTSQYFLLTPKLLSNLEYNPQITVHTIMNGKSIMNYKKWKIEQFLERAIGYRELR